VWSRSLPRSVAESQRALLYVALVGAVLALGRHASVTAVAGGVLAGITIVCSWNLVVRWGAADLGGESVPIGYANSLALLAAIGVLLAAGFALARRPLALVSLGALVPVLALTRSDGSLAALVCGAILLALARTRVRVRLLAAAAAALALGFGLLAWAQAGGQERGAYWEAGATAVSERPALGSGAGTYELDWLRLRRDRTQTLDAHSLYLESLVELGPLGLLLELSVVLVPLGAAARLRREPVVAATCAALVAYALAAGVDFHWEMAAVTGPVLLLGAALVVAADGERTRLGRRGRGAVSAAAVAVGAAAALALAGNAPLSTAGAALARGDFRQAAADAVRATRWAPWESQAWLRLGLARAALGERAAGRKSFAEAAQRDPQDWNVWLRLAAATSGEARRRALARAARLNPLYFRRPASGR
jgi:tetratricopeptide (TPR) repeat protein